jgi:hypothetical protein
MVPFRVEGIGIALVFFAISHASVFTLTLPLSPQGRGHKNNFFHSYSSVIAAS